MKLAVRILSGIVGLIAIYSGIRQMNRGYHEFTGSSASVQPQEVGERVSLATYGCSLRVPKGWLQKDAPTAGTMFYAPKESGSSANLIVITEPFAGTVRQYADANIQAVKNAVAGVQFDTDAAFFNDSGATSFKASFHQKPQGLEVAQSMYFFDGQPGKKIVITSTVPASQGAVYGQLFDSCVRTLTVAPAAP